MKTLDSRYLQTGNCFGQKFSKPGEVRYFLSPGAELVPAADQRSDGGFVIRVTPAASGAQTQQHNVQVKRNGKSLAASPAELEIQAGDGVLWYTTDPSITGFHVAGAGEDFQFTSARMENDAVYTHAFGIAGTYEWRDPHGSGVHGTIEVENPTVVSTEDRNRWYETVQKPVTVTIKGATSSPESVKISLGQTVFWLVEGTKGVAITDSRLLASQPKR
jgi:plastocyanin